MSCKKPGMIPPIIQLEEMQKRSIIPREIALFNMQNAIGDMVETINNSRLNFFKRL